MDTYKLLRSPIQTVRVLEKERHTRVIPFQETQHTLEDYFPLAMEVIPRHWWFRDLPDYTKKEGKTEEGE